MISERILIWTPSEKTNFCLRFTFMPSVWLHQVCIWSGFIFQCLSSPSMHLVWLHFPMSGFTMYASGLGSFPNVCLHQVCIWSGFISQCLASPCMHLVWVHFPMLGSMKYACGLASFSSVFLHCVWLWYGFRWLRALPWLSWCTPDLSSVGRRFVWTTSWKAIFCLRFTIIWLPGVCLWCGFRWLLDVAWQR